MQSAVMSRSSCPFGQQDSAEFAAESRVARNWYAVFTVPQNEKSVIRHLDLRSVESFLPTYEAVRVWKNRQRVNLQLPLFPSYVFVRVGLGERARVLQCPGVLRIIGTSREPVPVPDSAIDFLRSDQYAKRLEPYQDLIIGQTVRIKNGAMKGLQGVLVRKNNNFRFVLTLTALNQSAAIEINANDLEPIPQ